MRVHTHVFSTRKCKVDIELHCIIICCILSLSTHLVIEFIKLLFFYSSYTTKLIKITSNISGYETAIVAIHSVDISTVNHML